MLELVICTLRHNNSTIVTVCGELDLVGKRTLVAGVAQALRSGDGLLVLDLSGVTFMDAQGLSALVACRTLAARMGQDAVLLHIPLRVRRLLVLTALERGFTLLP